MQIDWTGLRARPGVPSSPWAWKKKRTGGVLDVIETEPDDGFLEMYLILFNASIFHGNLVTFW